MESYSFFYDYVSFFDGERYDRKHFMRQMSGSNYNFPLYVSSLGPHMLIIFDSDSKRSKKGFSANIIFEQAVTDTSTNICTVDHPCNVGEGHCHYDSQCAGSLKCGWNYDCPQNSFYNYNSRCCYDFCGQFLDMDNRILDYTIVYPYNIECSWPIQVETSYIVSVEFFGSIGVSLKIRTVILAVFFY